MKRTPSILRIGSAREGSGRARIATRTPSEPTSKQERGFRKGGYGYVSEPSEVRTVETSWWTVAKDSTAMSEGTWTEPGTHTRLRSLRTC
eukprot:6202145-Pleurochrysis_carterae.AAC.2